MRLPNNGMLCYELIQEEEPKQTSLWVRPSIELHPNVYVFHHDGQLYVLKVNRDRRCEWDIHDILYRMAPHHILPVLEWNRARYCGSQQWFPCKVTPYVEEPSPSRIRLDFPSENQVQKIRVILLSLCGLDMARRDKNEDWRQDHNLLVYRNRIVFHDFNCNALR